MEYMKKFKYFNKNIIVISNKQNCVHWLECQKDPYLFFRGVH
jgi:hypothetical protein